MDHSNGGAVRSLFDFAPHELSHSAFFAWLIDSTRRPGTATAATGLKFLGKLGCTKPVLRVDVEQRLDGPDEGGGESKLRHRNRPDITLTLNDNSHYFIETKVRARAEQAQIEAYANKGKLAFVSLAYHFDKRHPSVRTADCCLDRNDIREVLAGSSDDHPVVGEYRRWLEEELLRTDLAHLCDDESIETRLEEFSHDKKYRQLAQLQWGMLQALTESFEGYQKDGQRTGSGAPWTQFWFGKTKAKQFLFYRIDRRKRGAYLALRAYEREASPTQDQHDEARRMKQLWDGIAQTSGTTELRNAVSGEYKETGDKERDLALYYIGLSKDQNLWSVVKTHVPTVHKLFLTSLASEP